MLDDDAVILFQGDSITDAGRAKDLDLANDIHALGKGYALQLAGRLGAAHPGRGWSFHNRGISGNRVTDLYARWRRHAIHLQPDLISILIGINDLWHHLTKDDGVSPQRFDQIYRILLDDTKAELPNAKIVIGEPFITIAGPVTDDWVEPLAERRAIVKAIANDYADAFVPFQAAYDAACEQAPAPYWAHDGVHPTPAGHSMMADTWLAATAALFD